ncbi:MAG: PGPGW domain-containing protein [Thermoleophilia bacterium]|nr:PGPGW domain-containing protein [Thermoleophilia bacterium]
MIERVRERKEQHRQRGRAYRIAFGIAGFCVLLGGVVLSLPFVPGPGLLLVAIGLGMLALEFAWAERLLERALQQLERTAERAARATARQRLALGALLAATAGALVAAVFLWDLPGVPF